MNDEPATASCDCSAWKISLPARSVDFPAACACAERCDCRRRHRVRTTCAMLAVFIVAGAAFGFAGARREDDKNLATLREVHLHALETGGGR